MRVCMTAGVRTDSGPEDDTHLFQLVKDPQDGVMEVKRAMNMLRMGRRDDPAVRKPIEMLRMGRSSPVGDADTIDDQAPYDDASKRKMSMLRMGRAMGMLRMGRNPASSDSIKRRMSMLRMG